MYLFQNSSQTVISYGTNICVFLKFLILEALTVDVHSLMSIFFFSFNYAFALYLFLKKEGARKEIIGVFVTGREYIVTAYITS